jgi:hypothetical protein
MKSELFVVNLVQSSEQAFSAVAELIPRMDVPDLLRVLQNPDRLRQAAANVRVAYDDVFEHLEKAIIESFNRRPAARLTREHLSMLQNADMQHELAGLLGCAPSAALQTLFSVTAMRETLEYLTDGGLPNSAASAAQLLAEVLKPTRAQRVEFDYVATENDWEPIVEGEAWLSPDSARRLLELAGPDLSTPCRALAEMISRARDAEKADSEIDLRRSNTLGPMGLIELRRRLAWIVANLHKDTIECAERAAAGMPSSLSVQLLLPVLQMYEFGNIAQGWRAYVALAHTLWELLPAVEDIVSEDVDLDRVMQEHHLIFQGGPQYLLANQEVGSFEVGCALDGQHRPQTILRVANVKAWVCRQLSQDIPKLTPATLSPVGEQLYERLLNTSFPVVELWAQRLKKAAELLGEIFIRALALSCKMPIEQIPDQFSDRLATRLPYQELPVKADPMYPRTVEEIISGHRSAYGQSLRIERGLNPSISSQPESP